MRISNWSSDVCSSDLLTTIEQIDRVYVNFGQSSSDLLAIRGDMGSGKVSVPQLERVEVQLILEDGSAYPVIGHLDFLDLSIDERSEEHTSELQSLMRISYAVFCLKKKKKNMYIQHNNKPITHHIVLSKP